MSYSGDNRVHPTMASPPDPVSIQISEPPPQTPINEIHESTNVTPVTKIPDTVNAQNKPDDDSLSSVSQVYVPEKDNLDLQDTKTIVPFVLNYVELTRLIRALPGLTPVQIRILEMRYISLINEYEIRAKYIDIYFHFSRGFISLGSVAVPALLSIQSPTSSNSVGLYWMTWTISLLVTIFHNFSTLFRFDKKFFGIHNTLERLKSEGWQYLELSGRYSGHYGHKSPTHENQFTYFVHIIEKIRLRQIEDEYNAIREPDKHPGPAQQTQQQTQGGKPPGISDQILPSPLDLTMNRGIKKENLSP
jgi:hypothetical protein